MSSHSSPRHGTSPQVDESQLPAGQCRYILTHPEIKGNRCACVAFTHNKAMPGSQCECGHLACFHMMVTDPVTDSQELVQLKQRIQEMEQDRRELRQQLAFMLGRLDQNQEIVARVSQLEEVVDRSKEEAQNEIKAAFRNLKRAWDSIGDLERRHTQQDDRLRVMDRTFAAVATELQNLGRKQMDLVETDINLEVRLDQLSSELGDSEESLPPQGRRRRLSASDSSAESDTPFPAARRRRSSDTTTQPPTSVPAAMPFRPLRPAAPTEHLWTVHISLLPTHSQPMPFEKDTSAYNRCLSRGLHRTVVINGLDAESFLAAVSDTFGSLLRGRPWMPLQAQSCTAERLTGLPMLRQLDQALVHGRYDVDFLREHCAVCDVSGKIESLYIAMTHESLTWDDLRRSPVFQPGLEASWVYDERFDSSETIDDDDEIDEVARPSAGDILQALPSSLKRAASEMSRSSSFGSAAATAPEGEGPRAKAPRVYGFPNVEVRRGVKTS